MDPALLLRTAKDSVELMRARHPFRTLAAAMAPSVSRCLPPAATIAAALSALFSRPAAAPAPPPKHGLTGAYYVATLETHGDVNPSGKDWFVQVWMDPNDFQLPRPFTAPAAVRVDPRPCPCGSKWLRLDGGILGRTDDMIAVRGNNFYPSALENVSYRKTVNRLNGGQRALPSRRAGRFGRPR